MRHLTIRLQLVWLTLAALASFVLVAATRPDAGVVNAVFAGDLDAFQKALGSQVSLATLNQFRGSLAADMVFLLAYGFLLRQSVLYVGRHRWNGVARHVSIAAMVADATENVCALAVLRAIEGGTSRPAWVFLTMNTAAVVKWTAIAAVLLFLAVQWRAMLATLSGGLRRAAVVVALSFAAGGLGSIAVAASIGIPPIRGGAVAAASLGLASGLLLQFRLVDMIGIALRLAYLTRVPLIVLLVAAAFGPLALGPVSGLLGAILDVPGAWGIGVVTAAAIVLAFACATQINLVRAYGAQRTFDRTLLVLRHRALGRAVSWTALAAVSSLVFCVGLASLSISIREVAAGVAGGAVFGVVFLFVLEWVSLVMSDRRSGRLMPQLAIPFGRVPLLGDWLRSAHEEPPPDAVAAVKARIQRWGLAGKLFGLASGYIEALPNGTRRFLPGHTFATIQFVLSVLFYIVLIFGKSPGNVALPETMFWVPTAGSIAILLLLNSWGLSGLTFFFDRYRTPLFTAVLALTLITGSRPSTDYEVSTEAQAPVQYQLATPGEVLAKFPRPLVMAVAGGGIQAGAWGARVLEGIDERLLAGGGLKARAALVSGVSGGSMGALYYGAFQDTSVPKATKASLEPSLDEIASALIGVDHLRRVFGVRVGVDRGAALERSWALRLPEDSKRITLRSWADRVRMFAKDESRTAQPFPAFLFNTTIVETGAPMGFVTTQFPTKTYRDSFSTASRQYPVADSVNRVFKLSEDDTPETATDVGLQMVTAARLSAAFPYVSPAAALNIKGSQPFHLVDGGYYDNYGLAAVAQWLDDALQEMATRPPEIGVVLIRGLAESAADPTATSRGWAWQLVAPPVAFVRTRSFGQWAGGMQSLKLLSEKWSKDVAIRLYLFDFPSAALPYACQASPLSWKLSQSHQTCIDLAWRIVEKSPSASSLWGG